MVIVSQMISFPRTGGLGPLTLSSKAALTPASSQRAQTCVQAPQRPETAQHCKPCGPNFLFVWCLCGLAGKNTPANVRLRIHSLVYSPWQSQSGYHCYSRFTDVKAEALRSSATSSRHTSKGFTSYCCRNILPQT